MKKTTTFLLALAGLTAFGAVFYTTREERSAVTHTSPASSESFFALPATFTIPDEKPQETEISDSIKAEPIPTDLYRYAYEEIKAMLEGRKEACFKTAVFLVDNAYMEGTLDWVWYNREIKSKLSVFDEMIRSSGYGRYKTAKNWAIHTYMTDTTVTPNGFQRYHYDYTNYMSDTAGLVYNLLRTHLGNCRSLPYLYKIWCNEYGATAFLATAPMHSYIKQQDENGIWWNLELTSFYRYMTSEDYIISFGVTEDARKNGLYMKALTEQENLLLCLGDLVTYYMNRNDIDCDPFIEEVSEIVLGYEPVSEMLLKRFACAKDKLNRAMKAKGISDYADIGKHPDLIKKYEAMDKTGRYIHHIGYRKFSEELYRQMVNNTEKKRKKYSSD